VGTLGYRVFGAVGPLHHQKTLPPACSALTLPHQLSFSSSGRSSPSSPSAASTAALSVRIRLRERLTGLLAATLLRRRRCSGHTLPRQARLPGGSSSPLPPFPMGRDEDNGGGHPARCTQDCTRKSILLLLFFFFFPVRDRVCVACRSSSLHRRHPQDEVVVVPSRLQRRCS
jgi:hypothetical protein